MQLYVLFLRRAIVVELFLELALSPWYVIHLDLDGGIEVNIGHRELFLNHVCLWRTERC